MITYMEEVSFHNKKKIKKNNQKKIIWSSFNRRLVAESLSKNRRFRITISLSS